MRAIIFEQLAEKIEELDSIFSDNDIDDDTLEDGDLSDDEAAAYEHFSELKRIVERNI